MRSFFLLLTLCTVVEIFAQPSSSRIDSLHDVLDATKGLDRFDVFIKISRESINSDLSYSLEYADRALHVALDYSDSLKIVQSTYAKGFILRRMGSMNKAIETLKVALEIAKRNRFTDEIKKTLNTIAIAYMYHGDYDKSLEYHFQAMLLNEETGNKEDLSITLNNIGLVYYKLRNHERAIEYYLKSLETKKSINSTYDLDRLLINLALSYNNAREYELAEKYINQALSVCGKGCSDDIIMEAEFGLGVSHLQRSMVEESKHHFEKSLALARELKEQRFYVESLMNLATVSISEGDHDKALTFLKEAETIANQTQYRQSLIDVFQLFSRIYTQLGDFEFSSKYQSKYISLKDSVYSEELIKNLTKVQTDFAERENRKTIEANRVIIKQQRDLNIAIVFIAILAGLLILVLQRSNRITKRVNAQLSEAKETIQKQNELLEIKNKDLDREVEKKTADLERVNLSLKQVNDELDNFIYKTSHDIRGPLASLKGMCNVALMDVKDPVALDYLRKLDTTAERLNSILTRLLIINQINNSKLSVSTIDFRNIINEVMMLEKKKGLPEKLRITHMIDTNRVIHSDRELVRIVLENLIDNAIKFYNESDRVDSFVNIHITDAGDGAIKARIIDNGIGVSESNPAKLFQMFFRASERSEIGGIGLYIVKTATTKLGGKVGLETTAEGHTEFYVVLPARPPQMEEEIESSF